MNLRLVGCSHHSSAVELRESLAFSAEQVVDAIQLFQRAYPDTEVVLLSTCNRVELYVASNDVEAIPSADRMAAFLTSYHAVDHEKLTDDLFEYEDQEAVEHLFLVASSLDSMVIGEAQILSQVKQAFAIAQQTETTGPILHYVFESANRVAKRVAHETAVNRRRVSIPSVAVTDYAKQLFETFEDKKVLLIGAGEMGEETLRYLRGEGARDIVVVNRSRARGESLARRLDAVVEDWQQLESRLAWADLVVSATGAREAVVTAEQFQKVHHLRSERLLFALDLAIPRDFAPEIAEFSNVYLYCIDDLQAVCQQNREARKKELPKAEEIVREETRQFVTDRNHRATVPIIQQLRKQTNDVKDEELSRLFNKLGTIDHRTRDEIERSFDRLVNKLLHPPLESLRDEAKEGSPHGLLNALRRLFQIPD